MRQGTQASALGVAPKSVPALVTGATASPFPPSPTPHHRPAVAGAGRLADPLTLIFHCFTAEYMYALLLKLCVHELSKFS
jgi:hypothetical protein